MKKYLVTLFSFVLVLLAACGQQTTSAGLSSSASALTIFGDVLSSGWQDWSWETNYRYLDCACPQSGSRAVQANFKPWGGLSFRSDTAISTSGYSGLSFGIYGVKGNTRINVMVYSDDNTVAGSTSINVTTGSWQTFNFSWAQLGNPSQLKRIAFQNESGQHDSEILVDNLSLDSSGNNGGTPPPSGGNGYIANSLELIVNDMKGNHEAVPHGVPDGIDWKYNPRLGYGNQPWNYKYELRAANAWGQIYETAQGNPATNTRVQIKDLTYFWLSKTDGQWHRLLLTNKFGNNEGGLYPEDFNAGCNGSLSLRDEAEGTSVKGFGGGSGCNYHFWTNPAKEWLPNNRDIAGVFTTFKARLIVDNPNASDDRDQARIIASAGGDYYYDKYWAFDNSDPDKWLKSGDAAIGKFKYVTKDWQSFNMHTMREEEIRNNPPPFAP